jgi:hypothetical protein
MKYYHELFYLVLRHSVFLINPLKHKGYYMSHVLYYLKNAFLPHSVLRILQNSRNIPQLISLNSITNLVFVTGLSVFSVNMEQNFLDST